MGSEAAQILERPIGFGVSNRSVRDLEKTDNLSAGLRACVHEYGFTIVDVLMKHGITKPARIHEIVKEVWNGARQPTQKKIPGAMTSLDWLLLQAGAEISAATLVRVLHDNHMVIVPLHPSPSMIAASMATVSGYDVRCSKEQKHTRRLRASFDAAIKQFWPHLLKDAP